MQPGTMPMKNRTRSLRLYIDTLALKTTINNAHRLTDPPRNAPTGFLAGGTEPKFGAASWHTTRVVEIRRVGARWGAALARENERETSLEAMVDERVVVTPCGHRTCCARLGEDRLWALNVRPRLVRDSSDGRLKDVQFSESES